MQIYDVDDQFCLFDPDSFFGKTSPEPSVPASKRAKTSGSYWRKWSELTAVPFMSLDLTPGHGNLLGEPYWEIISPYLGGSSILNTGVSPSVAVESTLSQILEAEPHPRYYLTKKACIGILRRAKERGKELPPQFKTALMMQAGLIPPHDTGILAGGAYHINQRNEGIDLHDVSGALMHTQHLQMQTFVTQPEPDKPVGFDGYNGDLTGDKAATLGVNCGMSTGRNGVIAFAANQRDEVRDLHDVAGALGAQPGMKQQTFVAENCLTPWDTQQQRVFTPDSVAPTVSGADGGGGRNPAGLLFAAAFSAGQGAKAGGIGFQEECAPTLKASESGTNMVPAILCLNDQGGARMDLSEDMVGTLRSQDHGHEPLVMANPREAASPDDDELLLFENYGIDSRYRGPFEVAPTMSARYGTGGNNVPLVKQEEPAAYCITGNAIDRQPQNGGNGLGWQEDFAYTLTATDHHAVFSRQRVDVFKDDDVASTESARQHKDATDLVLQQTVGALTSSDRKGPNSQYVSQDKCVVEGPRLIRRLTPLECERLQGFPDGWTDIPGASDSARYKALGNSVAIPCVEYIMRGIALAAGEPVDIASFDA